MVNGAVYLAAAADDFRLQRGDARLKLVHRQRIEILFDQSVEQIVFTARKIFVGVHRGSVDRGRVDVNKAREFYGSRKRRTDDRA